MKLLLVIFLLVVSLASCQSNSTSEEPQNPAVSDTKNTEDVAWIIPDGATVKTRFNTPEGFQRVTLDSNSFGSFLQELPLKKDGSPVILYNGQLKSNQKAHLAVVDLPIGKKDLHQCADAVMRVRADYLFSQGKYTDISFRLASGKTLSYSAWLGGKKPNTANLWSYLEEVFNLANTTSLNQQLKSKPLASLAIGDVFITAPPPGMKYGHAIIVVNKCTNKEGKVKFMLAQSYMPAQELQILDNPSNPGCPWYDLDFGTNLNTPEWGFTSTQLKSFE